VERVPEEAVMDPRRFDRWTKAVAATGSRRAALRGLAALGVAALAGRRFALPSPAAAGGCAGFGCPCADSSTCIDGLVCCGNSCQTSGYCGMACTGTGGGCPTSCTPGQPCADCCGGFCAGYGGCTTIYYSYEGGACSLSDPTACAPGLTCCPTPGGDAADGVCHDVCS
jgi:hypothetical protein